MAEHRRLSTEATSLFLLSMAAAGRSRKEDIHAKFEGINDVLISRAGFPQQERRLLCFGLAGCQGE